MLRFNNYIAPSLQVEAPSLGAYRRQLDDILPAYQGNSRSSQKQLQVHSYPVPHTAGGGLNRAPSMSGILTIQTGNNMLHHQPRHVNVSKLGPSGSGTLGTTTIEYDDGQNAGVGIGGALDDVEYLIKNSRVHSFNPRN